MLHGYLALGFGAPQGDGWHALADLCAPGAPYLEAQIAATEARLRTRAPAVVGSAIVQGYQWPILAFAVACYGRDRRVPDLRPANTLVHFHSEGYADGIALRHGAFAALPADAAAAHPDARVVPDLAALRDTLRAEVEGHLGAAIARLCERLGCKPRALWLNVSDGLAGTLAWLLPSFDKAVPLAAAEAEVSGLLGVAGSPLHTRQAGLFALTYRERTQIYHNRATCCYWYKTEGGEYCSTCPHRTPADRNERLLHHMAEEYANA